MKDPDMEKRLKQSLDQLGKQDIQPPDFAYFADLVRHEKETSAKRQNLQFAIFIALAVFVVSALLLCLFRSFSLFLYLQVVAYVVIAAAALLILRKAGKTL